MKILITGASGMVMSRFLELSKYKEDVLTPDLNEFDLLNPDSIESYIIKERPDLIIHAAAYTNVGEAEKERNNVKEGMCYQVNVVGTQNLLEKVKNIPIINIGTDMEFDGTNGPYSESDQPHLDLDKLTVYGYTKVLQYEEVKKYGLGCHVRIEYPVRKDFEAKKDYLRAPLSWFDTHDNTIYPLFNDQNITITFIDQLVGALDKIIDESDWNNFKTYHVSSSTVSTPYLVIGRMLSNIRNVNMKDIPNISIKEFLEKNDPRRYPIKGGLGTQKTATELGMNFSTIEEIVDKLYPPKS